MKCSFHTRGCGLSLKIGDILLVDAGESIFFRCIWFVSVRRLDEHGNRGCKVGYVKYTTIEFWYSIPTIIILIGIQSGHNYCRNTVGLWSHLALMQSEYSRSHLLKAYARQCANTVGIQAESTNREIDYDVTNDIVPIVIWHYCRNAVGRLHSDYTTVRMLSTTAFQQK